MKYASWDLNLFWIQLAASRLPLTLHILTENSVSQLKASGAKGELFHGWHSGPLPHAMSLPLICQA